MKGTTRFRPGMVLILSMLLPLADHAIGRETIGPLYLESKSLTRYLVDLPGNYDPSVEYDLVVGMHGYTSDAEEFMAVLKRVESDAIIYAVPQAPYAVVEGGRLGYDWHLYQTQDMELMFRAGSLATDMIADLIADLRQRYSIGAVYLLGFSQGASQALYSCISRPDMVTGVISFCCRFETDWFSASQIKEISRIRAFLAHGRQDEKLAATQTEEAYALFKNAGSDVKMVLFDGGHEIPVAVLQEAIDWMR